MRITARTVPAGDTFMTRFPEWDYEISDVTTDGSLDEGKVRKSLNSWQDAGFLMWGSNDNISVLAIAVEFLHQLRVVTEQVEKDERTTAHSKPVSNSDLRLERRYARGIFAYTRFDFTSNAKGVRVRVSAANPRDIPGTALSSARRFAVYACRILLYIQRELGSDRLMLEGVGELVDVFEEADWVDRKTIESDKVNEANAKRSSCERRVGDYCSPICTDCRCYSNGKCVEAELPKSFQVYEIEKE